MNKNKIYRATYKLRHPDRVKLSAKKFRDNHKDKIREYQKLYKQRHPTISMFEKLGISLEEYNLKLKEQNYLCAICSQHQSEFKRNFFVDFFNPSDSISKVIRGLICGRCNWAIKYFGNNSPIFFENALKYLKKSYPPL